MNLVIIDKKDAKIKTSNETLVVDEQKIPFRLIDTLLIVGKLSMYSSDITKLTSSNITILLLSFNYKESSIIASTNSKSAELKLAQYKAAHRHPVMIAKTILNKKILSHINHLKEFKIDIDFKEWSQKIEEADNLDTLLGIEGSFSKLYFEHFFAQFPKKLHKSKRSKRPPLDPLNALMSLYYSLIYNIIAIRVISFGFESGIGFLHRPFRSHHALASDMLEIFRADINAFIYGIFAKNIVTINDFTKKGGVYLKYEGRKKLWSLFREFSKTLEPKIDAEISALRSLL